MRAIRDMGLSIPEDISVIGYDGIESGRYTIPRLSTIRQDTETLARKGVEDLLLPHQLQPCGHPDPPRGGGRPPPAPRPPGGGAGGGGAGGGGGGGGGGGTH